MLIVCLLLRAEREICEASVFARGFEGHLRVWAEFDSHVSQITYAINKCTPFVPMEKYEDLKQFAAAINAIPREDEEEEEDEQPSAGMESRLLAIEARLDVLEGKANVSVPGTAMGQQLSNSTTTTTTTIHTG